jgi:acetyl esterase/lipase
MSKATPQPVFLWPAGAPGALGSAPEDQPCFYPFLPELRSTRAAALIIPSGGYSLLALDLAGFQYARWLNAQGMTAFVLDHRVAPYRHPAPLQDGIEALRLIRAHAADYDIDLAMLGLWGSSSGGHLATLLAANDPVPFTILSFPVITMELPQAHAATRESHLGPDPDPALVQAVSAENTVTPRTPPAFLMATSGDPTVPVDHSLLYYRALLNADVPAELHLYDFALHRVGLAGSTFPYLASWTTLLRHWLVQRGVLPASAPPPHPPEPNAPLWPDGLTGPGQPRPSSR